MLYPLTFEPGFKERLWGGRAIEKLFGKQLPSNLPIGESWEIVDRAGDSSAVKEGPLAGRDLHWIVENYRQELLGSAELLDGRFPVLAKILDAEQTLSLQVHPPPIVAAELGGQPKTEIWYLAAAAPGAELYVGLRPGIGREEFEERLRTGTVAECFHRVPVRAGDAMFVPSGRMHAVGAGCVIFEIQQNSDTTYRVFDWNRVDRNGASRQLHVAESLRSIDFHDVAPALVASHFTGSSGAQTRPLVACPYFDVVVQRWAPGVQQSFGGAARIVAAVHGELEVRSQSYSVQLRGGSFCLLPAGLSDVRMRADTETEFLLVTIK
jgi:mannose-6-phosphate isomerase